MLTSFKRIKTLMLFSLSVCISVDYAANPIVTGSCDGYFLFGGSTAQESFNAGFSVYVPAWPLLAQYPGNQFQSGLPGTWMAPQYSGITAPANNYTDIEGGMGWWRDTRFATITPKFIMGGVASGFSQIANGVSAGKGTWDQPLGKYAVAQLSNRLLWPPDGLNLKQGSSGELFGYGYLPIPFTEPKSTTAGNNVPTGNNCWTLFLNAKNFKGPATFFLPDFWSVASSTRPDLVGMGLDTRPSVNGYAVQLENQYIPAVKGVANNGQIYARVSKINFPKNLGDQSVLIHNFTHYNKTALWDGAKTWFTGGAAAELITNAQTASTPTKVNNRISCGWAFKFATDSAYDIAFDSIGSSLAMTTTSLGYEWKIPLAAGSPLVEMPEFYQLKNVNTSKKWVPVLKENIPVETGLAEYSFPAGSQNNGTPYTTPTDINSVWKKPGPKAGPFTVYPKDGSAVTYYWYRFADQPAMFNNDISSQDREKIQLYVEKIHREWTINKNYIAPPTVGIELAELDAAMIVTPPAGLEVGYVPIVTKQEKSTGVGIFTHRELPNTPQVNFTKGGFDISVPDAGNYFISLHSLDGKIVTVLANVAFKKGNNRVPLTGHALVSGIYIARIRTKSSPITSFRVAVHL